MGSCSGKKLAELRCSKKQVSLLIGVSRILQGCIVCFNDAVRAKEQAYDDEVDSQLMSCCRLDKGLRHSLQSSRAAQARCAGCTLSTGF